MAVEVGGAAPGGLQLGTGRRGTMRSLGVQRRTEKGGGRAFRKAKVQISAAVMQPLKSTQTETNPFQHHSLSVQQTPVPLSARVLRRGFPAVRWVGVQLRVPVPLAAHDEELPAGGLRNEPNGKIATQNPNVKGFQNPFGAEITTPPPGPSEEGYSNCALWRGEMITGSLKQGKHRNILR